MTKIERILCPIDFSKYSAAALKVAAALAQSFGARVAVLHTQRIEAPIYFTFAQTKALEAQLRRSDRAAHKYAEKFVKEHIDRSLLESVKVVDGDAVESILRALEKSRADLLVMGTHGRTGLARIRLGSVAESVLRQASRPVLTVGPQALGAARRGQIQRVLCPVNYSELAHRALEYAVAIAEKAEAELIVGHVQEGDGPAKDTDRAHQDLCGWIPKEMRGRCSVHEVVRHGRPAEQIALEAERSKADLLVVGARARHDLGSILFGSTTEAVIRSAPCAVLSVIADEKR
jgi:nucleotide-binding universal stress UspA family protein